MPIYLYVKTHNITGLKYLGKTTAKDPHKYSGSGLYWKRHLREHGKNYITDILLMTDSKKEIKEQGIYYSTLWDIVNSRDAYGNKLWANLKPEEGDGGETNCPYRPAWNKGIKYIDYYSPENAATVSKNMSASRIKKSKKEKIDRKGKSHKEYYGLERAAIISAKISKGNKGRTVSDNRKQELSICMSGESNPAKRPDVRNKLSTKSAGPNNSQSTIPKDVYATILNTLNITTLTVREIAKMFKVGDQQVARIKKYSTRSL